MSKANSELSIQQTNQSTNQPINQSTKNLTNYILHLADNNLILTQRNGYWCGHGPILEQDIAITNITLDLIGQSRNFYQYAAELINQSTNQPNEAAPSLLERTGGEITEDSLAYLRTEREFKNCLLVEQLNGDWAQTILRQFLFSTYQFLLYEKLQNSTDEKLAAIAAKAIKEVKYHYTWSSEWVIRLGDGTTESRERMIVAINNLWTYTGEMFMPASYEIELTQNNIAVDLGTIKNDWINKVNIIFEEATLPMPENIFMQSGGKQGIHTEELGYLLTELQYLQKTYPGAEW
jgi:ring-1,2-phenylacetyl-CoA epoxidase subunit PaaC